MKDFGHLLRRLASSDASNANWQRDLWVIYTCLGDTAEKMGARDASEWRHKALEQISAMKQRGILAPADEPYWEQLRQKTK